MNKNMSGFDRVVRFVIAFVVAYLFYIDYISGAVGVVLLIVSGVLIRTSLGGFSPLYKSLGVTTCKKSRLV